MAYSYTIQDINLSGLTLSQNNIKSNHYNILEAEK